MHYSATELQVARFDNTLGEKVCLRLAVDAEFCEHCLFTSVGNTALTVSSSSILRTAS